MSDSERQTFRQWVDFLVGHETPSQDGPANRRLLSELAQRLQEMGGSVESIPGHKTGGAILAKWVGNSSDQPQLLVGHADTVWPQGSLKEMPLMWQEDQAFGPGIFDMKAGLALGILAMQALAQSNNHRSTWFFINSDEEIGSPETTEALVFTAQQCARAFVLEPAWGPLGAVKTERRGAAVLRLQVRGRAAHAGLNPTDGRNAIMDLAGWLLQCQTCLAPENTFSVGTIKGGSAANVVPEHAECQADIRMQKTEDLNHFIHGIRSLDPTMADIERDVTVLFEKPPLIFSQQNRALFEQAQHVAKALGQPLQQVKVGGASDGNSTSQYIPTLDGLGAIGGNAHARGEFIDVPATFQRLSLLKALLRLP